MEGREWNLFKTVEPHLSNKPTEISGKRLIKLHYSAKGEELPSPEQRMCLRAQSCLTLVTPWIIAHQVPLSMGFPRQECWSGLPFPSPGDLPYPGIKSWSPAFQADSLLSELPGKPFYIWWCVCINPTYHTNELNHTEKDKYDMMSLLCGI